MGEQFDRGALEDALVTVDPAVQHHLREDCKILGAGKKPGVTGDAAHRPGAFVVYFTTDNLVTINLVVLSRWNAWKQILARVIHRVAHAQSVEDVLPEQGV